jgi:hypothetical protein
VHWRKLHAGDSKEEEKPVAITIHFLRPPQLAASFVSTADSPMRWPRSTGTTRPANRNRTGGLPRVTEGRSAFRVCIGRRGTRSRRRGLGAGTGRQLKAALLPQAVTVPCVLNLEDDNRHDGCHHDRSRQYSNQRKHFQRGGCRPDDRSQSLRCDPVSACVPCGLWPHEPHQAEAIWLARADSALLRRNVALGFQAVCSGVAAA